MNLEIHKWICEALIISMSTKTYQSSKINSLLVLLNQYYLHYYRHKRSVLVGLVTLYAILRVHLKGFKKFLNII